MLSKIFWITFVITTLFSYTVASCFADGQSAEDFIIKDQASAEPTPNQASDASFDKRLPPVLPGEMINDSGKKMRVWSTSGPVPVQGAATPPPAGTVDSNQNQLGAIDVIVDEHGIRNGNRQRPRPEPR